MFEIIEVETINYCNNDCSFCPANFHYDERDHMTMPDILIEKIIRELSELEYRGQVNLFSQNEPFLDPRISDIASMFRKALPNAAIVLYTNCLSMRLDDFAKSITNIDRMVLNLYDPVPMSVDRTVLECLKYADAFHLQDKLEVRHRRKDEILTTKGGRSPNKKHMSYQPPSCILPFRQIVVKASGNIVLCCNDIFEHHILGNLWEDKLYGIWTSDLYKSYRDRILKGRNQIDICAGCDVDWRKQKGLAHLSDLSMDSFIN